MSRVMVGFRARYSRFLAAPALLLACAVPLAEANGDSRLLSTSNQGPESWTMALFGGALIFVSLLVRRLGTRLEK
jgi:hypothetical protein